MQKATLVHLIFTSPVKDSKGNEFAEAQFHDVYAHKSLVGVEVCFPSDPNTRYSYPWHRIARSKIVFDGALGGGRQISHE